MDDRALAAKAPDYETRAWNGQWELTVRKVAEIAFRHEKEVTHIARQLALVNHATEYLEENWTTLQQRLHPDQQTYVLDMVGSLQKPPRSVSYLDDLGTPQRTDVLGMTVVAPTGFGKTRLIESSMRLLAAGKQLEHSTYGQRPVRALLVTPSIAIQDQAAKHLEESLPDVTVGVMNADKKQPSADVVVVTIDIFNDYFEDGCINGHPVDVLMIDEVHHLSEPIFRKTFLEQWRGMTVGFTATPAYDLLRDVRNIIPHVVEHSNIMSLIENGRLNDGQIFTFMIDQMVYARLLEHYGLTPTDAQVRALSRDVIDTLVIEFVTPLLEQGRRGIIFCEQGDSAYYAKRLAGRFSALTLANGTQVTAAAMDSYSGNQRDVIKKFRDGKLQVVTTVDTGREGLDAEFDFVIINCNLISRLRGHQIVGRGTRPSKRFPVTVYAQFSNRLSKARHLEQLYSLEEAFGNTGFLEQGRTLRGYHPNQNNATTPGAVEISEFPDIIAEILARLDQAPIGETFAGVNRGAWAIEEGMVPLRDLIAGYNTTELRANKRLRSAGYSWRGQYEKTEEGWRLVQYYWPEAREFLHQTFPRHEALTKLETAAYFGVTPGTLEYLTAKHKITGRAVARHDRGRHPTCFDEDELEAIGAAIKTTPGLGPGDGNVKDAAAELGIDELSVLKLLGLTKTKRFSPNGSSFPLTADELARLRLEFARIPLAGPGEMHMALLAETAGVDWQVVDRNMTSEERLAARPKRYRDKRGFLREAPVWPADISLAIVKRMEKFKARKLPAYLLPAGPLRNLVRSFGSTPYPKIKAILTEGGFATEDIIIEGTRSASRCLSWPAIEHLISVMGKGYGRYSMDIDFARLPTGPHDLDPEKIAYAQQIQQRFIAPDKLQKYDDS